MYLHVGSNIATVVVVYMYWLDSLIPIMGLDLGRLKFKDTRNIFSRSSVGSLSREVIERFAAKLFCGNCLDVAPKLSNTDDDIFAFLVVSFRGRPLDRNGFGEG